LDYLDYFSVGVIFVVLFVLLKYLSNRFRIIKSWKFLAAGDEAEFDTGWKKLLKVSFTVKDAVQNLKIRVMKGSRGVQISAGENVYSYVRFATNVTSSVVNDVSFVFKVKKSWLVRHSSSEKDVKVFAFVNNRWRSLDAEIVGSDNNFVFVEAQSPVLAPVAVVGKGKPVVREVVREVVSEDVVEKKKVVHKKKLSFGWLKNFVAYGVLFVLLAVVFAGFAYLSQIEPLPEVTSGIQPQVWLQDTSQTLNLAKFFSDPDGDALSFSATSVEHIKITFDGSNAVLTPDAGWHGRASTTFSANDGQASVSSNEVILLVKKRFVPLWVKPYIPQIISGVLFVFVVVILIVFRENILKFLDDSED
ncbi:PGF-pre-PGF domain-containing protein, partial [Candidatus Woesearchaeota archaeon]|nr:PGF-pre-PGF domain-containing protein [Candidatus Woesearchaeota archaeon]